MSRSKLGDVCTIIKGKKVEQTEKGDSSIRYIQIEDLRSNEYIKYCEKKKNYVIANSSDIIIAWDGANAGTIGFGLNGAIGSTLAILRLNRSDLDTRFIGWLLRSKYSYLRSNCIGATIPHINRKSLEEIRIPLLPLETQKQIAKTLDTISELLSMRKQQLAEMDNLIKSIFYDMFGDPVTNEKRWTMKTVDKVCKKIMGGGTPSKKNREYFNGFIPWITPKDMKNVFVDDSIDHITEDAVVNSSAKIVPKKSVLMVIRSGILKKLLPVAINTVNVTINQDMKAFIPNDEVSAEYLLYFFIAVQNILLNNVRSVTADNIEFNLIKTLNIPCPPVSLQEKFSIIVTKIEEQKSLVKKAIDETQLLFDSLMSQYFD